MKRSDEPFLPHTSWCKEAPDQNLNKRSESARAICLVSYCLGDTFLEQGFQIHPTPSRVSFIPINCSRLSFRSSSSWQCIGAWRELVENWRMQNTQTIILSSYDIKSCYHNTVPVVRAMSPELFPNAVSPLQLTKPVVTALSSYSSHRPEVGEPGCLFSGC